MQQPSALSSLSPQNFSLKNFVYFFLKKPNLKKLLIFSQKSFSNFQKTELSYISVKAYSEPWHKWNLRHIQNTVNHLQWKVLQKPDKIS